MAGDLRGNLALDLKKRVVAVGADQEAEDMLDAGQRPPAQLQRRDGVLEVRRLRSGRYGLDLCLMLSECAGVGGRKVLGPDLREWRYPVGGRPMLEKGIIAGRELVHLEKYRVDSGAIYRNLSLEMGPRFGDSAAALEAP